MIYNPIQKIVLVITASVGILFVIQVASAQAQWPQPSASELFGGYDCHIVVAPTCICSRNDGRGKMPYLELIETVKMYPVTRAQEDDRRVVQTKWRRQCGLLSETDTAP